jgi:hypothetical protein
VKSSHPTTCRSARSIAPARGGFCKHIVALLLTWIEAPDRFLVRPPVAELLAGKSREDLIVIVELAIRRDPDLADMIELTTTAKPATATTAATPGAGRTRTISGAAIERRVERAFELDGGAYAWDDYRAGSRVSARLGEVRALGDGYAAAGRWADALAVYLAIVRKTTGEESYVRDDEGDLYAEVGRAAAGLVAGLAAQADLPAEERLEPEDRAALIDALFAYWQYGQDYDFPEDADPVEALASHATPDERATVEEWLRARLEEPDGRDAGSYRKRSALFFLADLKGDALSQEELLAEYQRAELWPEAAQTMLELDRVDEAIALAGRKLAPLDLLPFADGLIERDPTLAPRALDLIEGWLWEREGANVPHEQTLLTWLQARYATHDRPNRSLEMARRRFMQQPGFHTYEGVRTAAALPGRDGPSWDDLRKILLAHLREQKDWGTLVDVYLHEGDAAEALAALKRYDADRKRSTAGLSWGGWSESTWDDRRRRLAGALETDQPDEAIRLYQTLAEEAIEGRNRTAYQAAARHLAAAKQVYLAQNREPDWRAFISTLRETHKRLRALKEELDALDLR